MGVLYAKVAGQWEPIITAIEGSTGIQWPIQTKDPPLVVGADITAQVYNPSGPDAFIEINKFEMLPGTTIDDPESIESAKYYAPKAVYWYPLSAYGPFWSYNSPAGVGQPDPWLRDVNPDQDLASISSNWTGQLFIGPAAGIWYSTTPGKDQLTKPPGGYVPYDQVWHYNMDARWNFDHLYLGFDGLEIEHWQDIVRGYVDEELEPYWDAGIADLWLGSGAFFELFTDSFSYHPRNDVEVMSAVWGTAYAGDITSDPRRPEVVIWARWEEGRPGHEDDLQEDLAEREVHFTSHNMHLYAGPTKRGLPDGQLNRGNIPVLAAVSGAMGTVDAPQHKQYYRQIGQRTVTFTDGVGHIVFPEEIWSGNVHPQAVVLGTNVGGPMVAQVDRSGNQLRFYLDRTFNGDLSVSWSVDYQEPVWSLTRPVVGYIYVYGEVPPTGLRPNNRYFLHDAVPILIPWASSGNVDLRMGGDSYVSGLVVKDFSGATVGTVSGLSITSGQDSFTWTVPRNLYPVGGGTSYQVVNPDGQESNWFELRWEDIELPTWVP
jgi:hypothetical protein